MNRKARSPMKLAIAYFRVSRERQGRSKLGLEAQHFSVYHYAAMAGYTILKEFIEVESGRHNDRAEIAKAIAYCKKHKAILLIATLDRLARDVFFIATLINSHIPFVAVDSPNDTEFITYIKAAVAQDEQKKISERTKAALAAAKARGIKLGTTSRELAIRNKQAAYDYAETMRPQVEGLQRKGFRTVRAIMAELNRLKVPTYRNDGSKWHVSTVYKVMNQINKKL